jgi:hypothetical protein
MKGSNCSIVAITPPKDGCYLKRIALSRDFIAFRLSFIEIEDFSLVVEELLLRISD